MSSFEKKMLPNGSRCIRGPRRVERSYRWENSASWSQEPASRASSPLQAFARSGAAASRASTAVFCSSSVPRRPSGSIARAWRPWAGRGPDGGQDFHAPIGPLGEAFVEPALTQFLADLGRQLDGAGQGFGFLGILDRADREHRLIHLPAFSSGSALGVLACKASNAGRGDSGPRGRRPPRPPREWVGTVPPSRRGRPPSGSWPSVGS